MNFNKLKIMAYSDIWRYSNKNQNISSRSQESLKKKAEKGSSESSKNKFYEEKLLQYGKRDIGIDLDSIPNTIGRLGHV